MSSLKARTGGLYELNVAKVYLSFVSLHECATNVTFSGETAEQVRDVNTGAQTRAQLTALLAGAALALSLRAAEVSSGCIIRSSDVILV